MGSGRGWPAWALPALLLVIALAYCGTGARGGINFYDEGMAVYGAARVLAGELPYRDFWTHYTPGHLYLTAAVFRVFGPGLAVERALTVVLLALTTVLVFLVARRIVATPLALLAWFLWTARLGVTGGLAGIATVPALALGLLTVLGLLDLVARPRRAIALVSGAAAGLCVLFRQDLGAHAVLAAIPALALAGGRPRDAGTPRRRHVALAFALGALAVVLPPLGYFVATVPRDELVWSFVGFPLGAYRELGALPYPWPLPPVAAVLAGAQTPAGYAGVVLSRVPFTFVPLVLVLTSAVAVPRGRRPRARGDVRLRAVLVLEAFAVLAFTHAWIRPDPVHLVPSLAPATVLAVVLLEDAAHRVGGRGVAALGAGLAVALVGRPLAFKAEQVQALASPALHEMTAPRARGIYVDAGARWYDDALRFVRDTVPAGDRLFVGNTRPQTSIRQDTMFYFLAERESATRYHALPPGMAGDDLAGRMVAEIEAARVRWIVLRDDTATHAGPGATPAAGALARLVCARFVPVRRFGPYTVWTRSAAPAPPPECAAVRSSLVREPLA